MDALLGDRLARMAVDNQWAGIVINGCLRDSEDLSSLNIGIKALATCPAKPDMNGAGYVGIKLEMGGISVMPGDYLYADPDGVIVKRSS